MSWVVFINHPMPLYLKIFCLILLKLQNYFSQLSEALQIFCLLSGKTLDKGKFFMLVVLVKEHDIYKKCIFCTINF